MTSLLNTAMAYISKILGLTTLSTFPVDHVYCRTSWDAAYFDIASDLSPELIDQKISDAIHNTPSVFSHILNPTPRMQRSLLAVLHESLQRNDRHAINWANLLIEAYRSPYVHEVLPGLRAEITSTAGQISTERARSLLAFLTNMQAPFDIIDLN